MLHTEKTDLKPQRPYLKNFISTSKNSSYLVQKNSIKSAFANVSGSSVGGSGGY